MKEVCKLTTLELRMWNNEIQIGMLWDKNVDLIIEKSLVIRKNNVIHKTSRYNVTVCGMTVKECTTQWPSFTVLRMKGSPEGLQISYTPKKPKAYTRRIELWMKNVDWKQQNPRSNWRMLW